MAAPPPQVQDPTVLPYADLPARHGVQHEVRSDGGTIVLPPPPWWRRPEVYSPLIVTLVIALPNGLQAYLRGSVTGVLFCAGLAIAMIVVAIITLRRRRAVVLEVTPDEVRLDNVQPLFWTDGPMSTARTLSYARRDVYEVRFVEHSGNVVVRVHGQEMIEFVPSRDPRLNRWIAEQLCAALGLPA